MALMELLTGKAYYPPVSTWWIMPNLMGEDRPVVWISADDVRSYLAAQRESAPSR